MVFAILSSKFLLSKRWRHIRLVISVIHVKTYLEISRLDCPAPPLHYNRKCGSTFTSISISRQMIIRYILCMSQTHTMNQKQDRYQRLIQPPTAQVTFTVNLGKHESQHQVSVVSEQEQEKHIPASDLRGMLPTMLMSSC